MHKSLVVLKDEIAVLGPGVGFEARVLVNIPESKYVSETYLQ